MRKNVTTTVYEWLNANGIELSRTFLSHELRSHPKYPALVSITDLLDELKIDNGAYVVDRSKIEELDLPFLAHTDVDEGGFILVDPKNKKKIANTSLLKHWDGIAVFAEKPEGWTHEENAKMLRKERFQKLCWIAALIATVTVMILSLSATISIAQLFFFGLSILGFVTSIFIVQKEMGVSNAFSDKLCSLNSTNGCEEVLQSKASSIGGLFKWSDIGLVYFASLLLLQVLHSPLVPYISLASLPFTCFSIYYQAIVEKKWCTLCLTIVAILWTQCMVQFFSLPAFSMAVLNRDTVMLPMGLGLILSMFWLGLLRPALQRSNKLLKANLRLTRFKYNAGIFKAALHSQRRIDTTPMDDDLQIGNAAAGLQILVACNTFCNPCAKAHKVLHELVERNDISLTVRFALGSDDLQYSSANEANYILHTVQDALPAYKRQVLHDWFELMDLKAFQQKYPAAKSAARFVKHPGVTRNHEWARSAGISFTPTVFINGFELPENYKIEELRKIIRAIALEDTRMRVTS